MKHPLRIILAGLLTTAVFLIILIAAGLFDPKPVGTLQTTLPATLLHIDQAGQTIRWLAEPLPSSDFSVRGTAVWQSGTQDSGIGLAIGSETDNLIVAVSPLGYVLVQQNGVDLLPWQPWPHVRLGDAPNEIWIDVRGDMVAIRINRELLWQGRYALPSRRLGLFGENFGETAAFSYQSIQIYAP
ncbi:hypothetical protein MNBD_CHLOROFLEXI01-2183 [hydrothermal vent metagenome]|uniref:3-keto-disaccharide hydrolase domain-containing protein n=1 Tax=hydrothermal vent metagenome TaxID=652676 RepID=A0A3B0VWL0_9ZZZZ